MQSTQQIKQQIVKTATLFNRDGCGHIRLTGADRVRFLHNQTTQNIQQLSAGQGAYTVFVTSVGRTIDLTTVYVQEDALHVVTSPGMAQTLFDWMDRYIFFSDKVTLNNESEQTFMFSLLGEGSDDVMRQICADVGADAIVGRAEFSHQVVSVAGAQIHIAVGSGLAVAGYTVWGSRADAQTVWEALLSAGAIAGEASRWEDLRIRQGRPVPGKELTDEDNPLEAGLWQSVSFDKGCYIGQETIARLNTYKGVKKRLWGLVLDKPVDVGETVWMEENKIGKVTSLTNESSDEGVSEGGNEDSDTFALAYLRTKAGGEGLVVSVGDTKARVVSLPFVTHRYPDESN